MKKQIIITTIISFIYLSSMLLAVEKSKKTNSLKTRIGTYKSWVVALAYGRSNEHLKYKSDLYHKAKELEKDENKKEEFDKISYELEEIQKRLHLQVFGDEPIDEYIVKIERSLPDIAEKHGLELITSKVYYKNDDIEIIDITDDVAELFSPDEKTQKMLDAAKKYKPLKREKLLELIRKEQI